MPNSDTPGLDASPVDGLLSDSIFAGSGLAGVPNTNGAGDGVVSTGLATGAPNSDGGGAAVSTDLATAGDPNLKGAEGAAGALSAEEEGAPKLNGDDTNDGAAGTGPGTSSGLEGSVADDAVAVAIDVTGNADTKVEVDGRRAKSTRDAAEAVSVGLVVAAGVVPIDDPDSFVDALELGATVTAVLF